MTSTLGCLSPSYISGRLERFTASQDVRFGLSASYVQEWGVLPLISLVNSYYGTGITLEVQEGRFELICCWFFGYNWSWSWSWSWLALFQLPPDNLRIRGVTCPLSRTFPHPPSLPLNKLPSSAIIIGNFHCNGGQEYFLKQKEGNGGKGG